jgi:hypothetical protein
MGKSIKLLASIVELKRLAC